jgi:hypothetical protein
MMQVTWQELIETFNVDGEFPDLQTLLRGADMAEPLYAAETVFVNMLSEIIDSVQRFSPWFNQPAKAFGLVLNRRRSAGSPKWVLTREAVRHWAAHLRGLSAAIEKNAGLILAVNLLGEMPKTDEAVDPRIMASCACDPPHIIMAHQSLLAGEKIACEVCRHPFRSFNASADDAMNGH